MSTRLCWAATAVAFLTPCVGFAALSENLFHGDFENTAYLKNEYSYDAQGNPIGAHRFNSDLTTGDWGKWLGYWGPPSYCFNGYCGQGGFSTVDYPRQLGATMVGNDLGNNNRSLDPYNPTSGNHIMETIAFYPTMTQWVKAPTNQGQGPLKLSFDFFYNNWDPQEVDYDRFEISVWGLCFEPPHNIGITWSPVTNTYDSGLGSAANPLGGAAVSTTPGYEGKLLARFGWGDWWTDDRGDPETNGWAHVDSTIPTQWWDDVDAADAGSVVLPGELTVGWKYYAISVSTVVYREQHPYFWLVPGYGVNGYEADDTVPAIGFDNINFQVTTAVSWPWPWPWPWPPGPIILGDLNGDGYANALDISGFIHNITAGINEPSCDINGDGVCNALDIGAFVRCITGGYCPTVSTLPDCSTSGGGGAACGSVPEPAGAAVLTLALAAAIARRR